MAKKDKSAKVEAAQAPAAGFDSELDKLFFSSKAVAPQTESASSSARPQPKSVPIEAAEASGTAAGEDSNSDDDDDDDIDMSDIEREMDEQGFDGGSEDGEVGDEEADATSSDEDSNDSDEAGSAGSAVDGADESTPVHETLAGNSLEKRVKRKVQERELETKETRDKRSLFVGNLPISCVSSKALTKALHKHIIRLSPYPSVTRIEALRYRSVAFSTPTNDYAADSGADAAANEKRRARSRAFKDALAAEDGGNVTPSPYLNANQKRKVAYINQEINENAKCVNAYVTLDKLTDRDLEKLKELPGSSEERANRITAPVLAALIAATAEEAPFEGRHLRLDIAAPLTLDELVSSGLDRVVSSKAAAASSSLIYDRLSRVLSGAGGAGTRREDQSKTLFVGNLDFMADEEDLRAMLEAVVRQERGDPPAPREDLSQELSQIPPFQLGGGESEDLDAVASATVFGAGSWVQSVRIVRDAATQLGKGFAYVRFLDETCVDELMAIWESDEAFLASARGGGSAASNRNKGKSQESVGDGKREDGSKVAFQRKLKLNKRALRLARCKGSTSSSTPRRDGRAAAGAAGGKRNSLGGAPSSPPSGRSAGHATPQRDGNDGGAKRRRSMGAPTPGGSSPSASAKRQRMGMAPGRESSPTRPPTIGKSPSKGKAPPTAIGTSAAAGRSGSSTTLVPNPAPSQPRTASDLARLELKRNDPDRQAKRLAKKERKREEIRSSSNSSKSKGDKVKLDFKKANKKTRVPLGGPSSRGGAGASKGKALGGKKATGRKSS